MLSCCCCCSCCQRHSGRDISPSQASANANVPSVLWCCSLGMRKGIQTVKSEWCGDGMVICLERSADLHMTQLMPLPLTVSCFSKIQIGFTFLALAHQRWSQTNSHWIGPRWWRRVCVCVCVCACLQKSHTVPLTAKSAFVGLYFLTAQFYRCWHIRLYCCLIS